MLCVCSHFSEVFDWLHRSNRLSTVEVWSLRRAGLLEWGRPFFLYLKSSRRCLAFEMFTLYYIRLLFNTFNSAVFWSFFSPKVLFRPKTTTSVIVSGQLIVAGAYFRWSHLSSYRCSCFTTTWRVSARPILFLVCRTILFPLLPIADVTAAAAPCLLYKTEKRRKTRRGVVSGLLTSSGGARSWVNFTTFSWNARIIQIFFCVFGIFFVMFVHHRCARNIGCM